MWALHFKMVSWLVVIYFFLFLAAADDNCRPISYADAKAAAEGSLYVSKNHVSVGYRIENTDFIVVNVLSPGIYGQSLQGLVATAGDTTLICFRGTDGLEQLSHQGWSALQPKTILHHRGRTMGVLGYDYEALMKFDPMTMVPGGIVRGKKYIVSGFSLGGALASLFTMYMEIKDAGLMVHPGSSLITFGAPRIGNAEYAQYHDEWIPVERKLRFVFRQDVVPNVPPNPPFEHHSREVWVSFECSGWWCWHTKIRVTVCGTGDNPIGCSGDFHLDNVLHHDLRKLLDAFEEVDEYLSVKYDPNRPVKAGSFEEAQCS